jgi:DNA polymerase III delta prime subunit
MIKQPGELSATGKKFSMIIYGEPGIGKSTLALSAPNPILCDFDRGVLRVRAEHRSTTIEVSAYDEFLSDLDSDAVKKCETLVIDTAGSMVSMMYAKYDKQLNTKDPRKVYGAIKTEFSRLTGQIRDAMNKNVIYIFHSAEEQKNDKTVVRLLCEGSAKNIVWAPCDFGGYVYKRRGKRYINFTSNDEAFAKGCHGIHDEWEIPELPAGAKNELVSRIIEQARANIEAEDSASNAVKAQYEDVVSRGKAILETVKDAATAAAAQEAIRNLNHVSTSQKELVVLLQKKAKSVGLKFDRKTNAFVAAGSDAA